MRLPPADVLINWPIPNYDNPVTRGNALVIVNYVFISITVIIVALRLYTRIHIRRWFGLDDIFIIVALVFTVGLTAVVLLANQKYGWDRHVWDIPLQKIEPTSKIAMVAKIVFVGAATFTRLSLHCFYYRLVQDSARPWFKWLIHVNVAYTVGIFISFPFIAIFMCNPVKAYWTINLGPVDCMDEGVATMVCGILSCVADFATTVTPMPLVYGLRMPRSQRFAVAFLFGLGFIVTVAGIVRTWFIYRSLFGEWDQTWYAYPLWIAAAIEIDLGVICASAPVLKPLLAKIPFSLSATLSGGISFKKSTTDPSSSSGRPTPQGSRSVNPSTIGSSRKTNAIRAVPELAGDRGKSYELKKWDDFETGTSFYDTQTSAEGFAQEDEAAAAKGFRGLWNKVTPGANVSNKEDDMTITRTSEVELQVGPASERNSKRMSRKALPLITIEPPPLESSQQPPPEHF